MKNRVIKHPENGFYMIKLTIGCPFKNHCPNDNFKDWYWNGNENRQCYVKATGELAETANISHNHIFDTTFSCYDS